MAFSRHFVSDPQALLVSLGFFGSDLRKLLIVLIIAHSIYLLGSLKRIVFGLKTKNSRVDKRSDG